LTTSISLRSLDHGILETVDTACLADAPFLVTFALTAIGGGRGDRGHTFLPIDDPDAGAGGTSVFGINSPGVMVGNFGDTEGVVHGFVLSGGQFTTVTIAASAACELWGVNSRGTAVGDYYDDTFTFLHGFTRSAYGTITYLPDPVPGASSSARGINSQGAVIGMFTTDNFATTHGYIYENGSFTVFDVPGGSFTSPWRITDSGTVCGTFSDASGNSHGFLRDKKGSFTQIDVPGATFTVVLGLSDNGDIVGQFGDGTTSHSFLLRKGVYVTLDYPGATDTVAFDINNASDIVGTYNNFSRGFLATPSK
jgi:probable HAF family extracellular repeat protein